MDLTTEAQDLRKVLLKVMEQKGLGEVYLIVEQLYALLDTKWKTLSADHFMNTSAFLRTRAEEDLKRPITTHRGTSKKIRCWTKTTDHPRQIKAEGRPYMTETEAATRRRCMAAPVGRGRRAIRRRLGATAAG